MKLLYLMMKAKELKKDIIIAYKFHDSLVKMVLEYHSSNDVVMLDFNTEGQMPLALCWFENDWKEIQVLDNSFTFLRSNNLI